MVNNQVNYPTLSQGDFLARKLNPVEMIILDYLKKLKKDINMLELSKKIGMSYPTTMKYVGTLELKGKIKIIDFGNKKMVSVNSHPP